MKVVCKKTKTLICFFSESKLQKYKLQKKGGERNVQDKNLHNETIIRNITWSFKKCNSNLNG